MSKIFKVEPSTSYNATDVETFFGRSFNTRKKLLSKFWRWWYQVSDGRDGLLFVSASGKLIGSLGFIPHELKGGNFFLEWLVDLYVSEEYRNKGVAKLLCNAAETRGSHLLAICNEQSYRMFIRRGWVGISGVVSMRIPLTFNYFLKIFFSREGAEGKGSVMLADFVTPLSKRAISLTKLHLGSVSVTEFTEEVFRGMCLRNLFVNEKLEEKSFLRFLKSRFFESPFDDLTVVVWIDNSFFILGFSSAGGFSRFGILYSNEPSPRFLSKHILILSLLLWNSGVDLLWCTSVRQHFKRPLMRVPLIERPLKVALYTSPSGYRSLSPYEVLGSGIFFSIFSDLNFYYRTD